MSNNKDYTSLLIPTHLIPPRSSLTPRRLFLPASLISLLLLAIASFHFSSVSPHVRSYIGRTASAAYGFGRGRGEAWRSQAAAAAEEVDWDILTKPLHVDASVEERLRAWDEAPLVEPADWVRQSMKTCPSYRIQPNQNKQQLEQSHLLWSSMNSTMIGGLRASMISHLHRANKEGRMSKKAWGTGRGLVFTAGNVDTFSRVLLTLKLLHKHLNSPLPSEIFSFPGEAPTEEVRKELEGFGATLRVVNDAVRDGHRTKNYHIKSTAIIKSRFREVLYLDSDNMPTAGLGPWKEKPFNSSEPERWTDSAGLWESKAYKRLGVMFWPDYWRTSADNPIWALIGVPCRDEWEQEAGQILIDKSRHLDALILSEWMMDSSRFKFNFSDGDKDMFRYSFLALRKRWGVPGKYVTAAALPSNSMTGFCSHTMLQSDHRGRPMFVHANLLKQISSGVGKGYAWGKSRSMRNFKSSFPHQGEEPDDEDLEDHDVDCDHLANAQNDGRALSPAGPAVRKRAALEKGIRPFFHGGQVSALCIDMGWNDPRSDHDQAIARMAAGATGDPEKDKNIDISFTSADDGLEILWRDPLQILEWKDDVRLRDFEET
ncbi:hypothetical protein T439DRAFT_286821 [Meredithblackwellia eburnea MCA 4105]